MIEQDLRNLRRFSGARRRLQNQPRLAAQRRDDGVFELEDRQLFARSHVDNARSAASYAL